MLAEPSTQVNALCKRYSTTTAALVKALTARLLPRGTFQSEPDLPVRVTSTHFSLNQFFRLDFFLGLPSHVPPRALYVFAIQPDLILCAWGTLLMSLMFSLCQSERVVADTHHLSQILTERLNKRPVKSSLRSARDTL